MRRVIAAIRALHHGASVADPATWKKRQVAVNAVVGLVSALSILAASFGWLPQELADQTIMQFGEGLVLAIFAAMGAFNVGVTAATSNKVGLGRKPGMPEPVDAELYEQLPMDNKADSKEPSAAAIGRKSWGIG